MIQGLRLSAHPVRFSASSTAHPDIQAFAKALKNPDPDKRLAGMLDALNRITICLIPGADLRTNGGWEPARDSLQEFIEEFDEDPCQVSTVIYLPDGGYSRLSISTDAGGRTLMIEPLTNAPKETLRRWARYFGGYGTCAL